MSKAEEKNSAMSGLRHRLQMIGLDTDLAATNLIKELEEKNIRSSLVECVDNLINTMLIKRKKKIQTALDKAWKDVPE